MGHKIALYECLSYDDELQGESNSILNQKQMLEEYAKRNGLQGIQYYTDEGITGTSIAKRKNFVQMMEDA